MIEGLEMISNLITRYAVFESLYLVISSCTSDQIASSIVKLYTAMLGYLSCARRYYNQHTPGTQLHPPAPLQQR